METQSSCKVLLVDSILKSWLMRSFWIKTQEQAKVLCFFKILSSGNFAGAWWPPLTLHLGIWYLESRWRQPPHLIQKRLNPYSFLVLAFLAQIMKSVAQASLHTCHHAMLPFYEPNFRIRNRIVLIHFFCVQFDNIYNQNLLEEIALVKSAWTYS